MKLFFPNIPYKGYTLDLEFCAKNVKEAARITDLSEYYISKYVAKRRAEKSEIFEGVKAKAYGFETAKVIGNDFIDFDKAKTLLDEAAEIRRQEWRKTFDEE